MSNPFNHLLIVSDTGTYLCTNMGYGANYSIEYGREIFCRPEKCRDGVGFNERLGTPTDIREITQEQRLKL